MPSPLPWFSNNKFPLYLAPMLVRWNHEPHGIKIGLSDHLIGRAVECGVALSVRRCPALDSLFVQVFRVRVGESDKSNFFVRLEARQVFDVLEAALTDADDANFERSGHGDPS